MEMYFWLFGTAVVFTGLGYYFRKTAEKQMIATIVEGTIDSLIKDGYLKTRGHGSEMTILKVNDTAN